MSASSLPSIFELCQPRADVLVGRMADADFAADLASVIGGSASAEYLRPRFFANTYPTRGLRDPLANVCRRLSGAGDEAAAIFRLDTTYGGGKTHGLIALAHAAVGMRGVADVGEFVDPKLLPSGAVRIAAFDGENADPANGRKMDEEVLAHTPWGEIAYWLGMAMHRKRPRRVLAALRMLLTEPKAAGELRAVARGQAALSPAGDGKRRGKP